MENRHTQTEHKITKNNKYKVTKLNEQLKTPKLTFHLELYGFFDWPHGSVP